MDTLEYMNSKKDIRRRIMLDDESINEAFRMIAENIDDVLTFDGIDLARIVEKGKVFG